MHLTDFHSSSFDLTIVEYQFPRITNDAYDSNWLQVRVDVMTPYGAWSASAPCLLTYEAFRIVEWLGAVTATTATKLTFMEPELVFALAQNTLQQPTLRIYFAYGLLPPWAFAEFGGLEDVYVEFALDEVDIEAAAAQLRTQLQAYPQRALK